MVSIRYRVVVLFADMKLPSHTAITTMTAVAAILIFVMFGANSVSGVLAFAIVYGMFAGGCKHFSSRHILDAFA